MNFEDFFLAFCDFLGSVFNFTESSWTDLLQSHHSLTLFFL